MRNMEKTAMKVKGQFNYKTGLDKYDMQGDEMIQLIQKAEEGQAFDAISMAFCYGFVLGHRATAAGKIKEKL